MYVEGNPINYTDPTGHDPVWNNCPKTPKTDALNTTLYDSCYAFVWVVNHQDSIRLSAQRNGIPPELVAGILASEIDFDTDQQDISIDNYLRSHDTVLNIYCFLNPNPGPGVGNIHYKSWHYALGYYQENGYSLAEILAPQGIPLSKPEWAKEILIDEGTIEAVSVMARFLADYRTGTGGQPKKTTHYTDLTPIDMGHIFGAYRQGVKDLTCFGNCGGYQSIRDFQSVNVLGPDGTQSLVYFETFTEYFSK